MKPTVVSDDPRVLEKSPGGRLVEYPLGLSQEEFGALSQSIYIMVVHRPSEGFPPTLTNSIFWWGHYGTTYTPFPDQFGGFIEMVRGAMARQFLEHAAAYPKLKYLVLIDADQGVAHDAPYRLAFWDKPVVSGVVCSFNQQRGAWANFTVNDKSGVARFPSVRFTKKMPMRGLIEVNSCGTGLMCIRKDVLEKILEEGERPFMIPDDVRKQSYDVGTMKYGEDISFCHQVKDSGFPVHVDLSVRAEHYKLLSIGWPEFALDPELDPADWEVAVEDYHHG